MSLFEKCLLDPYPALNRRIGDAWGLPRELYKWGLPRKMLYELETLANEYFFYELK